MIPAREGSQRLIRKNFKKIKGHSLIELCIKKCIQSNIFDEIWVNSDSNEIENIAKKLNVNFYKRPKHLADNNSTSEEFTTDFLNNIKCDYLFQVHTITPLLTSLQVKNFVKSFIKSKNNTGLSFNEINLECLIKNSPINFNFNKKQNSQDLSPVQQISWAITGWKVRSFLQNKNCKTYTPPLFYYKLPKTSSIAIKTQEDLDLCRALYNNLTT